MVITALVVAWLAPLAWLFAAAERAITAANVGPHDELTGREFSRADDCAESEPIAHVETVVCVDANSPAGLKLDRPDAASDALFKWATPRASRKQDRLRQVA